MVDKNSSIPLYLQIQNELMDHIRQGEYQSGQQVPSELEIASQYNVSRMTARKSLDNLVSKGILFRRRGKGTYVSEGVVTYGLSTMLSFSRTLQSKGYDVSTRVLVVDVIPCPDDLLQHLHLSASREVIMIRRLRSINGKPAAIHTAFLDYQIYAPIQDYDLNNSSLHDAIHKISGIQVAYTNDWVQADLASPNEAKLLDVAIGSPVLRVQGVAYSDNGQPARFSRAVYRGDMFSLNVKNAADPATSLKLSNTN